MWSNRKSRENPVAVVIFSLHTVLAMLVFIKFPETEASEICTRNLLENSVAI
jgi:hypothetical protein